MRIIIFISVIFIVFGLAGYYVYNRITQSFEETFVNSTAFLILYIFLVSSFFIGKTVEHFSIGFVSNAFVKIGSVGIGFFIYAFLFAIFFDFIRLINFIIPFYPEFITANYQKTKLIIGLISFSIISIIFISGYINALSPKVKKIDISINKSTTSFDKLNIVAVSDIHLGTMVNKTKLKRLINIINDINPDVVIIGGDIIDDNLDVVKHFKLLDYFKEVKSKYGIYSFMGNHEYISRAYKDLDYFEKKGFIFLKIQQ